ncbi:hypothetical protein TWF696_008234 [Orbilia brochopaga]|uniref:Uncharacterized protein n=1 Tax=Orbilia brochopaga TaxID=3140254 RepID=A0AAV9UG89_9PEZI
MQTIRTLARTVRAPTRRWISSNVIPAASTQPKIMDMTGKFNPTAPAVEVDEHIKAFGDTGKNGPIWRAAAPVSEPARKNGEKESDVERHNREFRERAGRSG